MSEKIELAKKRLEEEKKRLLLKEKRVNEREKKQEFKKLLDIGRLALKAKIDSVDSEALLGAFLEIGHKKEEQNTVENWRKEANAYLNIIQKPSDIPISIKFTNPPSKEIEKKIKELKFNWNRFLKVYYGNGNVKILNDLLSGHECKIEEIK